MGSESNKDNLTAAYIDHTAVIRVEGRGSFKISPPMKQFIHQVMGNGSADRIVIDMADCTGMDSTFMGLVAGTACMVKSKPGFGFKLINLSEKNLKLFKTLGVDRVVHYSMAGSGEERVEGTDTETVLLEPDFEDKLEAAKTTLEAHETLVDINPENLDKFKSVLEFLKDDVNNLDK